MSYRGIRSELLDRVKEIIESKSTMTRDLTTIVLQSRRKPLTITFLCKAVKPLVGEITPRYMRAAVSELGFGNRLISVDNKIYRAITR